MSLQRRYCRVFFIAGAPKWNMLLLQYCLQEGQAATAATMSKNMLSICMVGAYPAASPPVGVWVHPPVCG